MNWATNLAWIMDPKGPPPVDLYKFAARRVKIRPATTENRDKIKGPRGFKKTKRESLEVNLDNLCRKLYKLRDLPKGYGHCMSCGALLLERSLQWGHFIAQGQSQYLRWDPRNFGAQCVPCNILQQGRQVDYGAELDRRHGAGFSEGLRQEAHRHKAWKPSLQDLEDRATTLKAAIQDLQNNPPREG